MTRVSPVDLPAVLEPFIREALAEAESRADLPKELVEALRDHGAFRMLTPREYGGTESSLTELLDVYERLARIDASVAWTVWNGNWGFLGALLDERGAERLWGGGADPVFANSGSPGTAVAEGDAYRVSGHWKIVSGIGHADRLVVVAVVLEGGAPREVAAGVPDVRLFVLGRDQVEVRHTWDVTGMRGTGSDDVLADGAVVPAELAARFDVPARLDRPPYRTFIPALVLPGCTAVALGVARAMVDDVIALAPGKTTMTGTPLADTARAQSAIARAQTDVRAAHLLLMTAAGALTEAGENGEEATLDLRADLRGAMSHAAQVCRRALVSMYELAGSASLYRHNTVERRFRDGMAALQHANHSADCFEAVGRVRLGAEPGLPLF
ncbi:acyl-CoA dehydrogenase family protein [Streptomyces justiciae]|uniref:Acyl-CoA dehydrogenase family protein n=1 Tax=Streptomyces justiciae TaxID=2780140 RepID=A0ABU3M2D9_9ACTN|nr:acyl-CoA dehydrogenase family protein [Streptomyces justiciae]MDT7845671.1 acyl-CoA dehydrogenase family protein [Streptomyces justiciae]